VGWAVCDSDLIGDDQESPSCSSCSKGWHVHKACLFPTPGGEPLWHVADDLAIFASALHPTEECCSRRLPGIAQRDAFTCGTQFVHNRAIELRKRWVVPGSRLFSHVSARLMMRGRLRGWRDTRQSGSPPGVASKQTSSTCQPFRGRARLRFWQLGQPCQFVWVGNHENIFDSTLPDIH
jgi:hypothetical protein